MLLNNVENVCFATATGRLAQSPPSNTTWLICFATATGRLAQWPPSNTTWLICFATATGQFDQTWRTVQNKPRSGWYTGSRSGTHFPQALINCTYETVQQHNKITYRSNSNKRAIKLVHQRTTTFSNVRQTAKHEAASFAQRNCDVIHQAASFARGSILCATKLWRHSPGSILCATKLWRHSKWRSKDERPAGRPIERKNTGQLSLACTGHPRDHR